MEISNFAYLCAKRHRLTIIKRIVMKQQEIMKDSIEQAYCFFHQKWRIYEHSTMAWQKDDIEYAIAQYVEEMNGALYDKLSGGNSRYLVSHDTFAEDMPNAIEQLEGMMN